MLKTVSQTRDDVRDYIRRYAALVRKGGPIDQVLNKGPQGKTLAHEIRVLCGDMGLMAAEGRGYLQLPDLAASCTDDEIADLTAITEELDLAASEGAAIAHPGAIFQDLPSQDKHELTERIGLDRTKSDLLRARIRGDLRNQQAPPAGPPVGVGGNNK